METDNCPSKQLVWIVYGQNKAYQEEAKFSLISALLHTENQDFLAVIYTDGPEEFSSLPVTIRPVSQQNITDWSGSIEYNHRIKPAILTDCIDDAQKTILIDSDTIFLQDPANLFSLVNHKSVLVDAIIGSWKQQKDSAWYKSLADYLQEHYRTPSDFSLINSGVIGVTNDAKHLIEAALDIIDNTYVRSVKKLTIEQFALAVSISISNHQVVTHNNIVHHYWSRKQIYRAMIRHWLQTNKKDYFSPRAKNELRLLGHSLPKLPAIARVAIKVKALKLKKENRQFYKEIYKAFYQYGNSYWQAARTVMIQKALINLKQRHPSGFAHLNDELSRMVASGLLSSLQQEAINTELNHIV